MWKARYTVSLLSFLKNTKRFSVTPAAGQQSYECKNPSMTSVFLSLTLKLSSFAIQIFACVMFVCGCVQPFSNGLVTVMVPQLRRENSLLLWSTLDFNSPVHAFVGHDDVVLEFQWRPQKEG